MSRVDLANEKLVKQALAGVENNRLIGQQAARRGGCFIGFVFDCTPVFFGCRFCVLGNRRRFPIHPHVSLFAPQVGEP